MSYLKTEGDFTFRVKRTPKTIRENDKGTPYVFLSLAVEGGPCNGDSAEWKGYLNGGAFDVTVKTLEKTFFEGQPFSDFFGLDEGRVSLVDRLVPGSAEFEEYNGKQYLRVNLRAPEDAKISDGKLSQLDAMAKSRAAQIAENVKPVVLSEDDDAGSLPF